MKPASKEAYDLLHKSILTFADMEASGIMVDVDYYKNQKKKLKKKRKKMKIELMDTKEVKEWKKVFRTKFKVTSDDQLRHMLFEVFDYEATEFTEKEEKPSVEEEALRRLDIPWVNLLIERKRLKRVTDKINGILRETIDGVLHPSFNLHKVPTYRGSCDHPNFQNMDKRNPEMAKIIRSGIIPRPGRQLLEIDFKGNEIKSAACYHKDPKMIEYLNNPKLDMHRDLAAECYMLKKKQVTDDTRYCGKNKFIFPEFFGSYFEQTGKNLWNAIAEMKLETVDGLSIKKHLKRKGIKTEAQFITHIKAVEADFWDVRFKVYRDWKEDFWDEYLKRGWIEMLTGFRCHELLKRTELINRPIQGTAFHWLLWSLNRMNKKMRKNMETLLIGQIHDSALCDVVPCELEDVLGMANEIMTKDIMEHWDWIIVPLEIECTKSEVDGSWYDTKEIENKH